VLALPTAPPLQPSLASTVAFLSVVAFVCCALLFAVGWSYRGEPLARRRLLQVSAALALWMTLTASLAQAGVFASLAEDGRLLLYPVLANGLAVALALSRLGARLSGAVPLAALIGFQGFRLPLELVLHTWYEQGVVPVQMTYAGDNFDIVTGVLALTAAALMKFGHFAPKIQRAIAWGANVIGLVLLIRVASIALRSTPGPLRAYLEAPPLTLPLLSPYTWILSICVAGALAGHLLTFRRLLRERQGPAARQG
jgi:hypothetical protein